MLATEDAQGLLDGSPFGPWWGFRVAGIGPGRARVELPFRAEFLRLGGVLQGGCAMTLADVTCWLAVLSLLGADDPAVTLGMTTTFLAGARTGLRCESEVVHRGGRMAYGTASTADADGRLVAHHTLTYLRPGVPGGRRAVPA